MSNRAGIVNRVLVGVGVALLIGGLAWLSVEVFNLGDVDVSMQAGADLRVPASVAVLGCLFAAFGHWKQEQETLND